MITYLVIGIIWLVMINVVSLIENKTTGMSECEKVCIKDGTPINTMPKRALLLSCLLHVIAWPIAIPFYIWVVYLRK